jgi:phage terminase large subunit-like protein
MVHNPEIRILLVSKTLDLSSRFITTLRQEIESNDRIRHLYGHLKPDKPRAWNREALFLERQKNIREPTVRALGLFGSCAGLRADLIVADDIIDSETCFFKNQRDRVHQWFLSELTPVLEADGRMIVVGTRKHHDDLYSRLIANPAYNHRIDRAILDEKTRTVLMPERWTFERLLADREEIGTVLFNREKQNEVIDEATALFRREWLEALPRSESMLGEGPRDTAFIVQGIDLASVSDPNRAFEKDTDYSVVLTLAALPDDRFQVAEIWMDRGLSPDRLLSQLVDQTNRYAPRLVLIENNAFQHWVEQELKDRIRWNTEGHTTGRSNKGSFTEGVPSLAALFERRRVILPCGDDRSRDLCGRLIDQFHGLGFERHDDLAMAFWFAVTAARKVWNDPSAPKLRGPLVRKF